MFYSPSGSSVLGILQARILEWVATSFSNPQCISWICRQVLYKLVPPGNPIYAYVYIYLLHMCNFCWMLYYCLKCMYFQGFYEKFLDLKKILNPKLLKRLIYVFENYFTYTLYLNSIQYYKIYEGTYFRSRFSSMSTLL